MPIPGDPDAVLAASEDLTMAAKDLQLAREGLAARGRTITADWRRRAAPAALALIERHAADLQLAVEAVAQSSPPLATYAAELRAAQQDYARGEQMMHVGQTAKAAAGSGAVTAADAAREAAEETMDDAAEIMLSAEDRAQRANEVAAHALAQAVEGMSRIVLRQPAPPVVGDTGPDVSGFLAGMGNAAASMGNAVVQDFGGVLTVAGGVGLVVLGAGGEVGGLAMDTTGFGIPAGVAAHIASAGVIATGATMVGVGAASVAQTASGDGRVEPFGNGGSASPRPPAARQPQVENRDLGNLVRDLYRGSAGQGRVGSGTTADAVRFERATGQTVGDKVHTQKANNYVRALRRWLRRNPNASPADRAVAQREYDDLLDALGRTQ